MTGKKPVGRPAVGSPVHVRLGDLHEQVQAWATRHNLSVAESVRRLVAQGLDADRPSEREDTR